MRCSHRDPFATWAIENHARELDVQYLLGHSTSARLVAELYVAQVCPK